MPTSPDNPLTRLRERVDAMDRDYQKGALLNDGERIFLADLDWLVSRVEAELEHQCTIESAFVAQSDNVAMVSRFYAVADTLDTDGHDGYAYLSADGQNLKESAGLIWWANQMCEYEAARHLSEQEPR